MSLRSRTPLRNDFFVVVARLTVIHMRGASESDILPENRERERGREIEYGSIERHRCVSSIINKTVNEQSFIIQRNCQCRLFSITVSLSFVFIVMSKLSLSAASRKTTHQQPWQKHHRYQHMGYASVEGIGALSSSSSSSTKKSEKKEKAEALNTGVVISAVQNTRRNVSEGNKERRFHYRHRRRRTRTVVGEYRRLRPKHSHAHDREREKKKKCERKKNETEKE